METKNNPFKISAMFSSALDAELAISLIAQFAYRSGCHIPKFEIVKLTDNLFKVNEILPELPL